jgi:hypothetical protein
MAEGNRQGGREGGNRRDAGKIARDAGAEIGDAITRAGQAAGTALIRAGELASDALSGWLGGGGGALASGVVPELTPLHPMQPGDEVQTRVKLVNEDDSASEPFELSATDLVSDAGKQIAAEAVALPSHQRVVAAHQADTVALTLKVPADAQPGVYRGELRGAGVAPVPLVIEVR